MKITKGLNLDLESTLLVVCLAEKVTHANYNGSKSPSSKQNLKLLLIPKLIFC